MAGRKPAPAPAAVEKILPELHSSIVDIDTVAPHPRNYNNHDKLASLRDSLTVNGQYRRIIAQACSGHIVAGNGVWLAAKELGWTRIAAERLDIDDDHARRLLLVDNASQSQDWDDEQLAELLAEGALAGTGITQDEYDKLLARLDSDATLPPAADTGGAGLSDPDAIPAPPVKANTRTGDVWLLGPHRLVCGDSRDPVVLAAALAGHTPALVHTDPPYGIDAVDSRGKVGSTSRTYRPVTGDHSKAVAAAAFTLTRGMYPKAAQIWWGANHYAGSAAMPDSSCWLIWDKQNEGMYFADAEVAWTNHKGAVRIHRHQWNGGARGEESGVERVHPNQKPVAMLAWAMDRIDPDREQVHVLDPFAGSGSILLAAHATGRTAHLVEIDPLYCDVIARRWTEHTGTPAVRGDAHIPA